MDANVADFVDAIPFPALLIRRDEYIETANDGARALLGKGIVGRHFITALRQPLLLDAIETTLRDGQPRQSTFLSNDGQQDVTYKVSVRPVPTDRHPAALVCFEDVTHLEQAEHMRRDFVANVSHELRTPLTAIMGFIETLQGPARGDPKGQERFLGIMLKEAQRMNRLVGDLLQLSRVEANERMRPTEWVDPVALIKSTVGGLAQLAEAAQVSVTCTLPEDAFQIKGDEDQLRQVLVNLIENGIKYSGQGAQVSVTLLAPSYEDRLRCQAITIRICDTGPGIEQHHLPRLTERFYRVDNHRSREKGGTGLGLAIVKHIISRHRGRLQITSQLGKGTCFAMVLPVG
ncbi:sensor histidine kinase [Tropicibacter naphthalenivorans]|uniref:histidine kinase n=1 Tax=Tropicibacter naphthalenivorans TaxID=441103 RepID=A0A0P1GNH5_9RHOB|nr:ATP-binding protein [Tropicibacter naphthalenivorans]CUH77421.1 Alkaline phosphatase synthesis sensor protein PhoR [Tropicibacter naphthalenivorans]SMC57590.1 two-component system, OmpR family, phosphate regulon sensor histidine kinase PhoR [Tropicibacter naphthalenivorans]